MHRSSNLDAVNSDLGPLPVVEAEESFNPRAFVRGIRVIPDCIFMLLAVYGEVEVPGVLGQ